ncbi:Rho GTPase activation protein, partial [Dissoconium aciculare CBS 342.82]|uniref:Rho GTPase activation protein n=1 Tax=Dissoconium aciculare CBS 342.82 TaxID=1314786 RepID=A0A6J3M7L2_9PEZI
MFGKAKEQARRGKSAERGVPSDSEENLPATTQHKDSKGGFKASGKNALSKAKAGGGSLLSRLGKIGRSGSSNPSSEREREVPDNEYVFKVINLPLVEQTRITRISKQINACRDKTEYWMPSLPWRCIDYLNSKCEYEGLYRVPGSGPQVKRWQRRFDTELDIDILKEETYDVNEIASMLKAWLRELPTEIFPAQRQKDLAAKLEKENPKYKNVGEPAPQLLRDALSELPPFNYYLLFAITCHLSLILNHKDQNRMDLNNLAVCVGPCLNLDRWLFNYLVGDWRNCWRGCNTE